MSINLITPSTKVFKLDNRKVCNLIIARLLSLETEASNHPSLEMREGSILVDCVVDDASRRNRKPFKKLCRDSLCVGQEGPRCSSGCLLFCCIVHLVLGVLGVEIAKTGDISLLADLCLSQKNDIQQNFVRRYKFHPFHQDFPPSHPRSRSCHHPRLPNP